MIARHVGLMGVALAAIVGVSLSAPVQGRAPSAPAKQQTLKLSTQPAHRSIALSTTASPRGYDANGTASWYGASLQGRLDARGERFDENAMTAAHRTLPLNSLVRVTNLANGRHVVVRVTDRGPFAHRRIIDLSRAAAHALGYEANGTARVNVRTLS